VSGFLQYPVRSWRSGGDNVPVLAHRGVFFVFQGLKVKINLVIVKVFPAVFADGSTVFQPELFDITVIPVFSAFLTLEEERIQALITDGGFFVHNGQRGFFAALGAFHS
jgi:hypothetical protein